VSWADVPPLPFELACVPQRFYRFIGLPVVSYAIPALVAMGQARHHHFAVRLAVDAEGAERRDRAQLARA